MIWVGIGVPKQEKWMVRMRDRLGPAAAVVAGKATLSTPPLPVVVVEHRASR